MTDVSPLSTAFIAERPLAAAKVLSNLPPIDAALLIAALPSRVTAPAMAAMPPLNAAKCIAEMPSGTAASILQNMAFQGAASVLRIVGDACRNEILKDLPRGIRREFLRSLRYPTDSVGAWMDQFVTPLNGTQSVAEALQYAKQRQRQSGEKIFVVDNAQTYLGTIRISDLLLLDGKTVLSHVLEERDQSVSSRSTLAVLINDDSWSDRWNESGSLAVVGRKGNLLGVITRKQVKHGLASMRTRPTAFSQDSLFTHMFAALIVTLNGLAGLMTHSSGSARQAPHGEARNGW